jgi:hypothetical protein
MLAAGEATGVLPRPWNLGMHLLFACPPGVDVYPGHPG